VDTAHILIESWPDDLDPAAVPFRTRTVTVLRRRGILTNPTILNDLTTADVKGWWNAGTVTVEDLRTTGNAAIARHRAESHLRQKLAADLADIASQRWAQHIWRLDPRFSEFLPLGTATVYDIATTGTTLEKRQLWEHATQLHRAVQAQGRLSLLEAVSDYVEAISGQHGERLEVLLARTGLNGQEPIAGAQAARQLGVSDQRIHQLVKQLYHARDRAEAPAGVWLPQVQTAETGAWPRGIATEAAPTIRAFLHIGPSSPRTF